MLTVAPGESGGFHIKAGSASSYPAPLAQKHGSSGMENREKVHTHTLWTLWVQLVPYGQRCCFVVTVVAEVKRPDFRALSFKSTFYTSPNGWGWIICHVHIWATAGVVHSETHSTVSFRRAGIEDGIKHDMVCCYRKIITSKVGHIYFFYHKPESVDL